MNLRQRCLRLLWRFDRSLASSRAWHTLAWPLALAFLLLLLFWLVGLLWPATPTALATVGGRSRFAETVALLLGGGPFPMPSRLPLFFQLLIVLGGLLCLVLLVAATSVVLANRRDSYLDGRSRYHFSGHVLVLGSGNSLLHLLHALPLHPELDNRPWVILTEADPRSLRLQLHSAVPSTLRRLPLVIYRGSGSDPDTLRSCQIELASSIIILGDDLPDQDQRNIEAWNALRHLRTNATHMAQCFLFVGQPLSGRLLRTLPQESHTTLETNLINPFQAIARQTLIPATHDTDHLTLDRFLLTDDSPRYVHLVVVGLSPMGLAFADTAAQLCHFPNFDTPGQRPLRTRITLIDPQADRQVDLFRTQYSELFALSHVSLRTDASGWQASKPDPSYGDFLDIEWQFLKGDVRQAWIRDLLLSYALDNQQVLSLAFCAPSASANLADALSLPAQFFPFSSPDSPAAATPVVFVYQPGSGILAQSAHTEVPRYHNIVPFGMDDSPFDPLDSAAILAAKRVNYIHHKVDNGKPLSSIPLEPQSLNGLWQQLTISEKQQALHAATFLSTLQRNAKCPADAPASPDTALLLARLEHNRWNVEMLLDGFAPLPAQRRALLNDALASPDDTTRQEAAVANKRNASLHHLLKDITPFAALPAESRQRLATIVAHYHLMH